MKKQKEANKLIVEGLIELGAEIKEEGKNYPHPIYVLNTKGAGVLTVIVHDSAFDRESNTSVINCFSRFEEPEKANMLLWGDGCNKYTGKWNWHHWSKEYTARKFADLVLDDIKKIMNMEY